MRLDFLITNLTADRVPRQDIERVRRIILKEGLFPWDLEVSIALLSPREIRSVNRQFRGKDKATNVISVLLTDEEATPILAGEPRQGEILLCPSVLKKEADEEGVSYRERFSRMLLHGMIHLSGVDHERSSSEEYSALTLEDAFVRHLFPGQPS